MIASLPMYDWPETQAHLNHFWDGFQPALQTLGATAPAQLNRSDLHQQWQRDDLLLSQTCAYPLVTTLPESTVVVGTPVYQCAFCKDGYYASPILVHRTDDRQTLADFSNTTLAFNSVDSQSGFNALKSLLVEQGLIDTHSTHFFSHSIGTNSHRGSIQAVANGSAQICAVDPVSWALAQRFDNNAKQLRVLTNTAYSPALPLISSAKAIPQHMDEQQWRESVMAAFVQAIDSNARQHLLLEGICFIPKSHYLQLAISQFKMITQP